MNKLTYQQILDSHKIFHPRHIEVLKCLAAGLTQNETAEKTGYRLNAIKNIVWVLRGGKRSGKKRSTQAKPHYSAEYYQKILKSGKITYPRHVQILEMLAGGKSRDEIINAFKFIPGSLDSILTDIRRKAEGKIDYSRASFLKAKSTQIGVDSYIKDFDEIDLVESITVLEWFRVNYSNLINLLAQSPNIFHKDLIFDTINEFCVGFYTEKAILLADKQKILNILRMIYLHYSHKEILVYLRGKRRIRFKTPNLDDDNEISDDFHTFGILDKNFDLVNNDVKLGDIDHNTYSGIKTLDLAKDSEVLKKMFKDANKARDIRYKRLGYGKYGKQFTEEERESALRNHEAGKKHRKYSGWHTPKTA